MRTLLTEDFVEIPDDGKCLRTLSLELILRKCVFGAVTVDIKARKVTVTGSRGAITRNF